jgi:hypothetical protein
MRRGLRRSGWKVKVSGERALACLGFHLPPQDLQIRGRALLGERGSGENQ